MSPILLRTATHSNTALSSSVAPNTHFSARKKLTCQYRRRARRRGRHQRGLLFSGLDRRALARAPLVSAGCAVAVSGVRPAHRSGGGSRDPFIAGPIGTGSKRSRPFRSLACKRIDGRDQRSMANSLAIANASFGLFVFEEGDQFPPTGLLAQFRV